jgi:hypothetical protein
MKQKIKNHFVLFLFFIGLLITQRAIAQEPEPLTPNAVLDTVCDMFGNKKLLRDIMFDYNTSGGTKSLLATTSVSASCGYFNVYYANNSGMEITTDPQHQRRRAVICQVLTDLSAFINSPLQSSTARINLLVDNSNVATSLGAAGVASGYYAQAANPQSAYPGIADNEIWKTIHSGINSYTGVAPPVDLSINGFYHGFIAFNFSTINWKDVLTSQAGATEMDLYTVALHEITHALGFASLINGNGISKYGNYSNYYSRYDLFLKNSNNLPLLTTTSACPVYGQKFNTSINTNELGPASASCTTAINFAGSVNQKCYTPTTYTPGSSLSHFDDPCHAPNPYTNGTYYVMNAATPYGVTKRFLKQEERMALCDLGYNTNTTYGTPANFTNTTYTGSCSGIQVAGICDGVVNGILIYTTTASTTTASTITISLASLASNDYAAALPITITNLENVYSNGTISTTPTDLVFTATLNYTGPVLLRYVPRDANGVYGNITYVHAFITPVGCSPVSPCDMVQNGGFENVSGTKLCGILGGDVSENCWYTYKETPDVFTRGCTTSNAFNLGTNTFSSSPIWNSYNNNFTQNNSVLGLYSGFRGTNYGEAVQNFLGAQLNTGSVYQLTYSYYNYSGNFIYPSNNGLFIVNTPTVTPCILTFASRASASSAFSGTIYPGTLNVIATHTLNAPVNTWTTVTTTFTYTGVNNDNAMLVGMDVGANIAAGYIVSAGAAKDFYVLLDDISLLPLGITPTVTIPTSICLGTSINNLGQYASPGGGFFTGPGITYTAGVYNFNNPSNLAAGIYTISYTYTNAINCSYTKYSTVTIKPSFTVTPSFSYVYLGQSVTLTATGASGTYSWNPGALTGSVVVVTPTANIVYTVTNNMTGTCPVINTATVIVSTACSQTSTASYGTSSVSAVSFPAGTYTLTNQVLDLQGTIIFTGNTSFTGYTLRMAPGTKLIVNDWFTVTFDNCKLFACTELWYGIEVDGRSDLVSNLIVKNGTTIEDMYFGIYRNANGSAGNQSSITITDSKINKNYIGVQLLNMPSYNPSGSSYSLTVKNSTITTQQSMTSPGTTLKPSSIPTYTYAYNKIAGGAGGTSAPYTSFPRAYMGINLNNLSTTNNVVIGDSAGAINTFNTFSNLDFGIVAVNAQLRVHNNYFYNLKGSTKQVYVDEFNPGPTPVGPAEIGIAVLAEHTVANTYSLQVGSKAGQSAVAAAAYPKANAFKNINKGISAKNCSVVIAKGNLFDGDTTDIPDSDYITPDAGTGTYAYYKGQNAIWITALSKGATLNFNFIKNYRVGINASHTMSVTTGAYITVNSNNIQSLTAKGYCRQAINLEQVGGANMAANQLEVTLNTLNKVYTGIYAKAILDGLYIHDNTNITIDNVKTIGKGVTLNYMLYGINLLNTQHANVIKNLNINGTATITASNYSLTNAVYLTGSTTGSVTCNTVNNVGRAFTFQGTCNNAWLGNTMSNSYQGLSLVSSGVIGTQGSSPSGTLAANTWSNVTQETFVSGTLNANTASKMFVEANGTYTTAPSLNAGAAGQTYSVAFGQGIDIETGTPYSCSTGGGGGGMMAMSAGIASGTTITTTSDALFSNLATSTSTVYPLYPDEFIYQNQQLTYKLQKQGLVTKNAGNPTLQSFYNANTTSNIGKFTDVQDAIANNQKIAAQSKNNSITPTNAVQQKTKRVNELMLKLNINPNYKYNNTEMQDLVAIAKECTVKGWYVVQARNIMNVISGQLLYYDDNCDDTKVSSRMANAEETKVPVTEPKRSFTLFPNPNNGNMTMIYDLGKDSNAGMNLYDVTGKLINTYDLQNGSGAIEINEAQLHNGIYFYHILVNGNIVNTNKIVIIK